ncbi:MAG TPA: FAD:protein FMN transferase [Candidatus Dormibacteraeota bacterium]|nr:FAD:protein FMN transferase [Candidatus Dormibacteraeota bacterium]
MQYYQECIALGSKTGLSLISNSSPAKIENLYRELWRAVFTFERRFSRFLPDSELSIFNKNAGVGQNISPEFQTILTAAQKIAHETDGLYNPFILPALQAAGYGHSRVPGHEQDAVDDHSNKSVANIDQLEIGDNWAKIPYGTALDLGGCGKGYLADQLRSKLPSTVTGYWLLFGGDIAIGGHNEHNQPWSVTVQSADDPSKNIATLTAADISGIATSGTTVHGGKKAGRSWHHIIDPRTHQPAETDVLLATVCDNSTFRADVLASCAIILGGKQGLQFLKDYGVKAAVLQLQAANGETDVVHFGNGILLGTIHA